MIFPAQMPDLANAILETAAQICLGGDIPYFVMGGTLLGLYRGGTYISTDPDLDIAVAYSEDNYRAFVDGLLVVGFTPDIGNQWEGRHFWKYDILLDVVWVAQKGYYASHDILHYNDYDYHTPYPIEDYLEWKYGPTWRTPLKVGEYVQQHED